MASILGRILSYLKTKPVEEDFDCKIRDAKPGTSGYTVPWAIHVVGSGETARWFIRPDYPFFMEGGGTASVKIERTSDGLYVAVNMEPLDELASDGNPEPDWIPLAVNPHCFKSRFSRPTEGNVGGLNLGAFGYVVPWGIFLVDEEEGVKWFISPSSYLCEKAQGTSSVKVIRDHDGLYRAYVPKFDYWGDPFDDQWPILDKSDPTWIPLTVHLPEPLPYYLERDA